MALGTFVGGRYSSTLNSVDLGLTRDGYTLVIVPKGEMVAQSDAYAQTLLDYFFAGCDASVVLDSLEYKAGPIAAIWPWGTIGAMGIIARLASAIATSLVLSSTSGTPAASSPATLTATRAIIAPGTNISLLYTSKLRMVPIRFDLLPSDSAIHWTQSAIMWIGVGIGTLLSVLQQASTLA